MSLKVSIDNGTPSKYILPDVGSDSLVSRLSNVDFPTPEGPIRATTLPASIYSLKLV
jgi:hypothetical protein